MFSTFKRSAMPKPEPQPEQPESATAEQIAEVLIEKNRSANALLALQQQADDRRAQIQQLATQAASLEQAHEQLQQQIDDEAAKFADLSNRLSDDRRALQDEIDSDLALLSSKANEIDLLRNELAALVAEFSSGAVAVHEKQRRLYAPMHPDSIPTIAVLDPPFADRGIFPNGIWKRELPAASVDLKRRLVRLRTVGADEFTSGRKT